MRRLAYDLERVGLTIYHIACRGTDFRDRTPETEPAALRF